MRYYAEQNKSDGGRQIPYDFTHIQIYNTNKIKHKINEQTRQKQTHRYKEHSRGYQTGRGREEDEIDEGSQLCGN